MTRGGHEGTDGPGGALMSAKAQAGTAGVRRPGVWRGRRTWWVLAVIVILVAVLIWAGLSALDRFAGTRMDSDPEPVPNPPAEWEADPVWSTPALMEDAGQLPVIGGDKVALVTADRTVALVDAGGDILWSSPLPEGDLPSGRVLTPTRIDGRPVVALHLDGTLAWWDVETGEPGQVEVPPGPAVTYFGDQPLISVSSGTVAVLSDGQLQKIEVPEDATAFAARPDGVVVAASGPGRWSLRPGAAGTSVRAWEGVGADRAVLPVTWSWDRLIAVQKPVRQSGDVVTVEDGPTTLLVYSRDATTPEWSAEVDLPAGQLAWRPAPSGRWGMLNDLLVDLEARQVRQVPGWTTTAVASDRALGVIGDQRVLVGPSIPPGVTAADEGFPEDTLRLAEGRVGALVRTQTPGPDGEPVHTVSLLPPKDR